MRICYFDCFCGAGGDMIAASMVDAGLDGGFLRKQLAGLGIKDLEVGISESKRCGLRAVRFEPFSNDKKPRNLEQIVGIIENSKISDRAKQTAIAVFKRLGEAEAAVHGKDINEIHFHEVGAVDSIADIVSAAIGFDALGIEKVYCSKLRTGGGTVEAAHGLMPVPAPATAELIKGLPVESGPVDAELLTPTAAAIFTTVCEDFGSMPAMVIESIGCGAGTREFEGLANVLRLFVGEAVTATGSEEDVVCVVEANIDDASGEVVGAGVERLLEVGALDVFCEPIYMKKNRPGVKLSVICNLGDVEVVEGVIFEEGLSLGVRKQYLQRDKLAREFVSVETEFGKIRIKVGMLSGEVVSAKPEFSDCAEAAKRSGAAVRVVLEAAMMAYKKRNGLVS